MPGEIPPHPKYYDSLWEQLNDWARFIFVALSDPWYWRIIDTEYDSHLWTIAIEFRASMFLFLTVMGLLRI
jgi:hypothetical protein